MADWVMNCKFLHAYQEGNMLTWEYYEANIFMEVYKVTINKKICYLITWTHYSESCLTSLALIPSCSMHSREAANTNFQVFVHVRCSLSVIVCRFYWFLFRVGHRCVWSVMMSTIMRIYQNFVFFLNIWTKPTYLKSFFWTTWDFHLAILVCIFFSTEMSRKEILKWIFILYICNVKTLFIHGSLPTGQRYFNELCIPL